MNGEEFVDAIRRYVKNAAIEDTIENLKNPLGRRVPPEEQARSDWYNGLSEIDKAQLNGAIASAVHAGLFGFLCVLDGVRTIDDANGRFELTYLNDKRILLNPPSNSLHELLNAV